jgi:hypothetical protein
MSRPGTLNRIASVLVMLLILGTSLASHSFAFQPLSAQVTVQNGSIVFRAQNTVVSFDDKTGSISSISNLLTGQNTLLSGDYPLWSISTLNDTFTASDSSKFNYTVAANSLLKMSWEIPQSANSSKIQFAVQVVAKADQGDGGMDLGINVTNYESATVEYVAFPNIAGFKSLNGSSPYDSLAVPIDDGVIVPDFQQALSSQTLRVVYPGGLSMQFFMIYDNSVGGLYEGVEDPGSNLKALEFLSHTYGLPEYRFFWELYPSTISPGNQFQSNYFVSIASFSGAGWQDGATLYRSWVQSQWYTEEGPLLTRTDVPDWLKNVGLVWKTNIDVPSSLVSSVNNDFPNESALLTLWGWNRYGFDQGYLNYYPPNVGQETLTSEINQTHAAGDYVLMFLSGVLVDTNTTEVPDFPSLEQYMIINQEGQLQTDVEYNGHVMALPDPTSQWWQATLENLSRIAVEDYHADGIYFDGLALQSPVLDWRNSSSPTLSGSTFWQAYADILTNVTNTIRQYNPNAITTAEGENEVYIPYLDAFWDNIVHYQSDNGIQGSYDASMFSFVYHEYSLVYGSPSAYLPNDPEGFRLSLSVALDYGMIIQPEQGSPSVFLPQDMAFLSSALSMEQSYPGYLRFGELMPLPYISSANYTFEGLQTSSVSPYPPFITLPSVSGGLFRAINGSYLMVLSNPTPLDQQASIKFYGGEFGPSQLLQSVQICNESQSPPNCTVTSGASDYQLSIGNLSNIALRITPLLVANNLTSSTTSLSSVTTSSSLTTSNSVTSLPSTTGTGQGAGSMEQDLSYVVAATGVILVSAAVVVAYRGVARRK